MLFTDIVGSTSVANKLGDQVKTMGDGFLATFLGPTKAIQCACAIHHRASAMGLDIRAVLHTGECEKRGHDLSGIAVHLASRILDHAAPGEVVVSRTVKDLVVGSGVAFGSRGETKLRRRSRELATLYGQRDALSSMK